MDEKPIYILNLPLNYFLFLDKAVRNKTIPADNSEYPSQLEVIGKTDVKAR